MAVSILFVFQEEDVTPFPRRAKQYQGNYANISNSNMKTKSEIREGQNGETA